jgi:hypothetical protein
MVLTYLHFRILEFPLNIIVFLLGNIQETLRTKPQPLTFPRAKTQGMLWFDGLIMAVGYHV